MVSARSRHEMGCVAAYSKVDHTKSSDDFRFLATPFVVWVLAIEAYAWSIPLFVFVAFTDVIDGSLARAASSHGMGNVFDPIADKMLIALSAIVVVTHGGMVARYVGHLCGACDCFGRTYTQACWECRFGKPLGKGQNVFASQRRGALAPFFCVWRVVVAYGWRCCACGFCDFAVMSLMTYGL